MKRDSQGQAHASRTAIVGANPMPMEETRTTHRRHGEKEYSIYDLFILAVTLLSLAVLVIMVLPGVDEDTKRIAFYLDSVVSLVFMGDFVHSLATARDKRVYLKWGWLDFLGSLPGLPAFRLCRVARLVRILRILRRAGVRHVWQTYKARRPESTFWTTALVTLLLLVAVSLRILHEEAGFPEANIVTGADAVWWALVTLSTVGYGDQVPKTEAGRILAAVLMTVGVALVALMTSYITAKVYLRGGGAHDEVAMMRKDVARMCGVMAQMREEQTRMSDKLDGISRLPIERDGSERFEADQDRERMRRDVKGEM